MTRVTKLLLIATVLASPVPGLAQAVAPGSAAATSQAYEALDQKEQRRLDFYAEKIVAEIDAIDAASRSGDLAKYNLHGKAMKSVVERLISAAGDYGLTAEEADGLFQRRLASQRPEPLPFFLADQQGNTSLDRLMKLSVSSAAAQPNDADYISTIRSAGQTLFQQ